MICFRQLKQTAIHYAAGNADKSVREVLIKATEVGAENSKRIFNVALYALLFDQDIVYFTEAIVSAVGDRRRRFVAKNEAILLYEVAKHFPRMSGRDFRQAVNDIVAPSQLIENLNSISSE